MQLYLDTLINTSIASFNTSNAMVFDAFNKFTSTLKAVKPLMISDIPDATAVKKPFSTYADDIICCASDRLTDKIPTNHCVKGLSALTTMVNGMEIAFPEEQNMNTLKEAESLLYYILPDRKSKKLTSDIKQIGHVTALPEYKIALSNQYTFTFERSIPIPEAINVSNLDSFTAGFMDLIFQRFECSGKSIALQSDMQLAPEDIAAYRLGTFYADICLPRFKHDLYRPQKATVYLFTPTINSDKTPNMDYIQYVFAILSGVGKFTSALVIDTAHKAIDRIYSGAYSFTPLEDSDKSYPPNSYIIVTEKGMPLDIIGTLEAL